ncbi:MAG: hypothetical protein GY733_14635, partial [bacterium]|nr:hypothetical protein [bacterium]
MSIESRFKAASLHLLQAAAELVPLPQSLIDQRHGLLFARAAQGYQLSAAVGAALELGLYAFLAAPRKLGEVAEHTQMTPEAAEVLLGALEASGLCSRTEDHFELTRIARQQFLREHWTAGKGMVEFMLGSWGQWRELAKTLRGDEGHPDLRVYNPQNPLMAEYVRLLNARLAGPARSLVAELDLSDVRRVICGTVGVSVAAAVLRKQPKAELVVSCLPLLIQQLPAALKEYDVGPPSEIIENSGDAQEDSWGSNESYDLVFLARKFAYCGVEHGIDYLRKSMRVLPPGGQLILWEPFADNYDVAP